MSGLAHLGGRRGCVGPRSEDSNSVSKCSLYSICSLRFVSSGCLLIPKSLSWILTLNLFFNLSILTLFYYKKTLRFHTPDKTHYAKQASATLSSSSYSLFSLERDRKTSKLTLEYAFPCKKMVGIFSRFSVRRVGHRRTQSALWRIALILDYWSSDCYYDILCLSFFHFSIRMRGKCCPQIQTLPGQSLPLLLLLMGLK
ncbi:uncharacterized protein LOC110602719 isoform X3 [Manihot esculenta]|uniref:uncharacterized protein LOC110602719 isoform X3 n=1 Tax=Manihot esculenta TaxID=3983 RepID=UPI001CC6E9C8|nr:uncharacterized protein LOC110602719 isoform X3 [Manihot esculenta]